MAQMINDLNEETHEDIINIIEKLSSYSNNMCINPADVGKEIAHAIRGEHRTLQQKMITALVNTIIEYSKGEYFDARNQSSVELTGRIAEFLESDKCFFNGKVSQILV